jgi:hypothetical protein
MQIKSSVGLAVGPANAEHWGQVLVTPTAYGIIEIEDPQGHAQQLGVAALSFLGEALSRDVTSLTALEELADHVVPVGLKTLVVLVPVGTVIYLVIRGMGAVFVKRGLELASLMHEDGGISGEVKDGDTFLLASIGFSNILSHEELSGLFDHLTPIDVAEKLTILLHEKTGGEGSVALVFGVTEVAESEPIAENIEKSPPISRSGFDSRRTALLGGNPIIARVKQYFNTLRDRPKERTRVFAILVSLLFVVSVILGIWKQSTMKKNAQVVAGIADAQRALDEGVALAQLNPLKGRERLVKAKDTLSPLLKIVSSRSSEGLQLTSLYQKISDNLTQVMQVVHAPLTLFYDVSLLKKNAVASDMAIDGDVLAITDAVTQTVYELTVGSKNAQIVGGGAILKSVSSVAIHGDIVYALTPDGIVSFDSSTNKSSLIIKKDTSWGAATSLISFGGNLYVLDTQKSRIWKYVATDSSLPAGRQGFSDIREYLNPDTLPDLSLATGIAIDGSVWLGTSDGKILRFTQGKENTFTPLGVDPAFGTKLALYTSDDVKNVYVLDIQNHRVVVLDKDGMYLSQYQFTGGTTPTKLVVSESAKKILLLADGKIYTVDLK